MTCSVLHSIRFVDILKILQYYICAVSQSIPE